MALTDVAIRNAKPRAKPYKLGDASGLFLLVQPTGGKLWRVKYRVDGKEKKLGIGTYPEVSLGEARKRRDDAREMMAAGKDPSREKQRSKVRAKLESARRTLQLASAVLRYAVATARLASDPTRDLRGALTAPTVTHYGAVTDAKRVGELLRAIDGYEGQGFTKLAMQIAPHVFVRPGELRHADWSEIDLEGALWIIPAEKMKMRKPHHVPLSRQAVALFREVQSVTGPAGYVFPSIRTRTRPMSENTINAGLRRLGYASDEMTAHGFRAMASTLLNESGKWHPDAIERALAHGDSDKVRAAYHRGAHWQERLEMAQWWSDYLDQLRKGADIVPFPNRGAV